MSDGFADIKELTIKLQECFSGIDPENLKWSLLDVYKSKYLVNKIYSQTVVSSYTTVLSTLLNSLKPTLFSQKWQELLFDEIFFEGVHHEAFLVLVKGLTENDSFKQQKIIKLLVKFLQGSAFESLLMYQCVSQENWNLMYVSKSNFWDELITAIISLPERIANKTRGNFINLFSPNCYTPLLLSSVFKVLSRIHSRLQNSQDSSLEFLAKLSGRLCMIGNSDIVTKKYSKELINLSESDFIWRKISQNFISKMPALDSFITNLLLVIPWYGYVEWILGDEGIKNEKINYIMTVKILFMRLFKHDIILQNSIGYFASSPNRVSHFINILDSLLNSWKDERALRCQNIEQKVYTASALMICAGWMRKLELNFDTKEYISKVLKGTQMRLESSEKDVRFLGMIVGESLIKSFDPDSPSLEFEFDKSDVVTHLKSLLQIPPKPVVDSSLFYEDLKCFEELEIERSTKNDFIAESNIDLPATDKELDSDDDLEPYDMSNDANNTQQKHPLYLRDCMKGLIEHENAEWTEQCLKHAEQLIKNNHYAAQEIAEEMTKIVLHLDDSYSIPNFIALRHRILVALTVECPVVVASYLTSQFSAQDYNIRQRLDILEVLAASSMLLSHSTALVSMTQPHPSVEHFVKERETCWNAITEQHLEAKTKRFTKAQELMMKENKFSAIAGHFFYPLLNQYDRGSKFFNLHKESYVLGRFVYTLGIVMHSASNTVHCRQMGTTLLQFLASIRSHTDIFVRQSVLFAVAATYMSVPSSLLLTEMLPEVNDANEWLQSVAMNDSESSCIEKAVCTLSIFQSFAAEEPLLRRLEGLVIPE